MIRGIYFDAIENLGEVFYTKEQINAWSALAFLPGVLDQALHSGKGWISEVDIDNQIAAFAVRYPLNRLALLYCHSSFARQGHATALLKHIQEEVRQEGGNYLYTEASEFSLSLLIKLGWTLIKPDTIEIGGVIFKRYLMHIELY